MKSCYLPILAIGSCVAAFVSPLLANDKVSDKRPNVILVMTDDQGIGDFGRTGNSVIKTPRIDAFAGQSVSMSTFYVSPVCSPTRASLMTGRYNYRTRCIDTWLGRSMMDTEEKTVAEYLSEAGYSTGIFGKWHLGDCYPMRPQDQGFSEVLVHRGGGLAQPSEPRENERRYTDPILFHNGEKVATKGYCTDVYFDAAIEFIERASKQDSPFFAYIATNAPHGPYHDVPEDLRRFYLKQAEQLKEIMVREPRNVQNEIDKLSRIAAMITNIDQNMGRLLDRVESLELANNTLMIFLVDNGPNSWRYVGNRRGMKTNVHEGGVRSPLWMRWPARLPAGRLDNTLSAHIDITPTILDACGVAPDEQQPMDGRSLLPLFSDEPVTWPTRYIAIQSHRGNRPVRYNHFMIRDQRYKLLHASGFRTESLDDPSSPDFKLYDLQTDPRETRNLVDQRPEVFRRLREAYDRWFQDVSTTRPDNYASPRIHVGSPHETTTHLTRQDWRAESWSDNAVGHWKLHVEAAGTYDVSFDFNPVDYDETCQLEIGSARRTLQIPANSKSKQCKVKLSEGPCRLEAKLISQADQDVTRGVYQVALELAD